MLKGLEKLERMHLDGAIELQADELHLLRAGREWEELRWTPTWTSEPVAILSMLPARNVLAQTEVKVVVTSDIRQTAQAAREAVAPLAGKPIRFFRVRDNRNIDFESSKQTELGISAQVGDDLNMVGSESEGDSDDDGDSSQEDQPSGIWARKAKASKHLNASMAAALGELQPLTASLQASGGRLFVETEYIMRWDDGKSNFFYPCWTGSMLSALHASFGQEIRQLTLQCSNTTPCFWAQLMSPAWARLQQLTLIYFPCRHTAVDIASMCLFCGRCPHRLELCITFDEFDEALGLAKVQLSAALRALPATAPRVQLKIG